MEEGGVRVSDEEVDGAVFSDESDHEVFDQTKYAQEESSKWVDEAVGPGAGREG